jgi:hypothetical protein
VTATPLRFPDVETCARDLLDDLTPGPATVGIAVPADWDKAESPPHLQVAWDGTLTASSRLIATATIRVCAWAGSATAAKAAALDAHARLCAHRGGHSINLIRPGVGPVPVTDPDTGADLAWFTVRATVRSTPL